MRFLPEVTALRKTWWGRRGQEWCLILHRRIGVRDKCDELFWFDLQWRYSRQSKNGVYVSCTESQFGRSMLAVRKAYCTWSFHIENNCQTSNIRFGQPRIYQRRTAISKMRRQEFTDVYHHQFLKSLVAKGCFCLFGGPWVGSHWIVKVNYIV